MYSLSKNKNTYKIMRTKRKKTKGWIISSKSYMDLKKIADNLINDIPKVHLKRIDLTNTSSSIESFIKEEIDIDCSLSRNAVLDESTEKSNQQDVEPNISKTNLCNTFFENLLLNDKSADNTEGTYKDSNEYNNVPDYEVSNDSENSDDESNTSIVSQSFNENEKSNTTNSSLDTSQYSYEGKASCDDTNLIVPKTKAKGAGKKYFCMYCKKFQTKFPRHLEYVHKNEAEVKKFISLPKGNSKRKAIIETIRKESSFIYNTSSQYNTGELMVIRRPSKANKPASDFICCPKCKGYYTKKCLRYHFQKCNKHSIGRNIMVLARKIQARVHTKACDMVRKEIFPILRDDDVSKVIRYDELVILRANKLSKKLMRNHSHDKIRAELRLLGRYLISIKKFNSNITDFASIYQPRHYDSCILAIKDVAQFDPDTNKFKTKHVATQLGTLLKELGNLLTTEYIKRDDNEGLRNVDNFLKLLQEDYRATMNKIAEETVTQNKRHDKIELPSGNFNVPRLMNLYSDFVIQNTECIYEQETCL